MSQADDLIAAVTAKYDGADNEAERLRRDALRRLEWRRRHSGKQCDRCREVKPVSEFGRDSLRPDGLRRICRSCKSILNAEAYKRRLRPNTGPLYK